MDILNNIKSKHYYYIYEIGFVNNRVNYSFALSKTVISNYG